MITAQRLATYQLYISRSIAVLGGICTLSVFLYGVFLMLAVEHTAARTGMQTEIHELTVRLSSLETQYLSQTRILSPERAAELGYVPPTHTTAVFVGGDVHTLSFKQ